MQLALAQSAAKSPWAPTLSLVNAGQLYNAGWRFRRQVIPLYDPAIDTWTSAPPVPTPRGGGAGTLFDGMIVFLGGEDDKRTYDENEGFDLRTNQWVRLAAMPTGRHGFGVAALGKYLYVASGAKGTGAGEPSNEMLAFSLP